MAPRWTIAPSSPVSIVDDVLQRLDDLALVDPEMLVRSQPAPAGLMLALKADLEDALLEADQTVAMLVKTQRERREHARRLVLAARVERRAAEVALLVERLARFV